MKQDERDMLIKVVTTVDAMKEAQLHMDVKLDAHIDKDSTFVTKKMWMWLTGILCTVIFGAYIFTFSLGDDWHQHIIDREIHRSLAMPHVEGD